MAPSLRAPAGNGRPFDLVTFGENSFDFMGIGAVSDLSDKLRLSAFLERTGGQAATAAVGAARLGCRTRYVGVFGDDDRGRRVAAAIRSEQVDVVSITRPGVPSRVAIALIDEETGERRVLEHRDPRLTLSSDEVPLAALSSGRVLIVDATDLPAAIAAAHAARAIGADVIVDVERVEPGVDELLSAATLIVVAEHFPWALTGDLDVSRALRTLHTRFQPLLTVVTLGDRGSLARLGDDEIATPAFPIDARDTTGAGDAFRAGLAAAWLRLAAGVPVHTLMKYANATAALNCREVGAQAGLPDWASVEALVTGSGLAQSK